MADSDFSRDVYDELDREINMDSSFLNKRIAVRYRRSDIKAVIKINSAFFPRLIPVALIDISSKGAAIQSNKKLRKKASISLYLLFNDGRRFTIDGTIVHTSSAPRYGVKYDAINQALAEHLLHTQTDLIFG